jgi:PAS domain S-box-containing protein
VKVKTFLTEFLHRGLRLRGPLANDSTARILHALLLALVIWLTLSTLLVLLSTSVARLNFFLVPSLLVILVVGLMLLRLGFLRAASLIYLAGMFLYVTSIMILTGGIRNAPALVFYASLPISAAWLFGYRATLWMAGVCISSALVQTILDLSGMKLHPYLPAKPFAAWTFLVMAILIAALPVAQVLRTLQASLAQSHRSGQILADELHAARCLRHVATQSMDAIGIEAPCETILDTAVEILHADLASIQMVHAEQGTNGKLKLLGHRGFSPQAAKRWEWVGPDSRTTCGEALRTGGRVIVPDVRNCDFMAESEDLELFLDAGIHSAQTFPLVSRSGALLGMVTTYWRQPHELSESELRASDILARLAADVIERARAEEALWENQQRLASIYDTVGDVIFHLAVESDGHFRFASVNAAFLRVTGLTREAVVGRTVNEVIQEPSRTMVLRKYRQAVEENTIVVWEETSDYPTGRLTGEVSVAPVFDSNGNCTHLVGSVHDVTERNRAEETLRRNLDEIAHMNRVASMGELTASIAHEINQPLAAILSNAQAAIRFVGGQSPDLAQVRECLTDIIADDKRAGEVIRRIRGLLKQRASQPSLVDLNEVVSDAIRLLGNDAMLRDVSVKVESFPDLPAVLGDRIQLYQLVLNLIMNGLDAVAERPPGNRWVLVRTAEADGGGVELTVEDSGNGVAASDLARVFEPFFSTKREGLGIGLSISRSIVQAHGGKIWAENSARRGAIFHCVLPAAQQSVAAAN